MAMAINHNISAINTLRNLNSSNGALSKSLQKLSSGYRINVGADGPADLVISEKLRAQTVGLERAVRNTQEATNVIGIAEGALNEMNSILKTMRSLALHAANSGITSPEQVAADQSEVDSSIQTIDRIANTTKYSDQFLLNGNKSITFSRYNLSGNELLNVGATRLDQVFKRDGVNLDVQFTGYNTTNGDAFMTNQAERAYLEAVGSVRNASIDTPSRGTKVADIPSGATAAKSYIQGTQLEDLGYNNQIRANENKYEANDQLGQLERYEMYGVNPGGNTDADGNVYFEIDDSDTSYVLTGNASYLSTGATGGITDIQLNGASKYGKLNIAVEDAESGTTTVYLYAGAGDKASTDSDTWDLKNLATGALIAGAVGSITDIKLSGSGTINVDELRVMTFATGEVALVSGAVTGAIASSSDANVLALATDVTQAGTYNFVAKNGSGIEGKVTVNVGVTITDGAVADGGASNYRLLRNVVAVSSNIATNNAVADNFTFSAVHNSGVTGTGTTDATQWTGTTDEGVQSASLWATGRKVNVYSDAGRTNLIATGTEKIDAAIGGTERTDNYYNLRLAEQNSSGLTGYVKMRMHGSAIAEDNDISLKVTDADIDQKEGVITKDQQFILSGTKGSFQFNFAKGTDLGSIAAAINNISGSTGVQAATILDSSAFSHVTTGDDNVSVTDDDDYALDTDWSTTLADWSISGEKRGENTDADGNIYLNAVKTSATEVSIYAYRSKNADGTFNDADLVASAHNVSVAANTAFSLNEENSSGLVVAGKLGTTGIDTTLDYDGTQGSVVQATIRKGYSSGWDFTNEEGANTLVKGYNTDAEGKIYASVEWTGATTYRVKLYKDAARSDADLVATGEGSGAAYVADDSRLKLTAVNGSGLNGSVRMQGIAQAAVGTANDTNITIQTDMVDKFVTSGIENVRDLNLTGMNIAPDGSGNTDSMGNLYIKTEQVGSGYQMTFYKDANMSIAVAKSETASAGSGSVKVNAYGSSGLSGTVDFASSMTVGETKARGQVALRLFAGEYGSNEYIRVQNLEGNMFSAYNSTTKSFEDIATGATHQENGQDAEVTINGQKVTTQGLSALVASQTMTGEIAFNAGKLVDYYQQNGAAVDYGTTIAQIGYDVGSSITAAGRLEDASNLFVNAGTNSADRMYNFQNGMQFQLGEGQGDQERTVFSIQSMTVANLGQISIDDSTYSLQDILAGGSASLAADPVKALSIIDKAIEDVSNLRARLGAAQANLLQTNENNLSVAIENITATESSIRDANMAQESTQFTKNQILVQAGTAMLAQANTMSQSVLSLLQ